MKQILFDKGYQIAISNLYVMLRGPIKKNVTKSGKSPKGGGTVQKIKKSKIQNLDFLIRGGMPDFQIFPKCKCRLYMLQMNKK